MPAPALRPRAVTEILDAAFHVYRAHFRPFALLSIALMLPIVALGVLVFVAILPMLPQAGATPEAFDPTPFLWIYAAMPFVYLWMALVDAALQIAAGDAYLRNEVSAWRAVRETARHFWRVIGATLLKYLLFGAVVTGAAIAIGIASAISPFLGIPLGIALLVAFPYAYGRLALIPSTCVLEDSGPTRALERTITLSKDHGWRIVGALVLVYLLLIVVLATVTFGLALFGMPIVGQVIGQVLWLLIYPVVAIVTALLYYDLRIRKEGFDLELMSAELARLPESPRAGGALSARAAP